MLTSQVIFTGYFVFTIPSGGKKELSALKQIDSQTPFFNSSDLAEKNRAEVKSKTEDTVSKSTGEDASVPVISIAELESNSDQYDNKVLKVTGYFASLPDSKLLGIFSDTSPKDLKLGQSLTINFNKSNNATKQYLKEKDCYWGCKLTVIGRWDWGDLEIGGEFYTLYIDKFPNKKNETTKKYEPIKLKKEKVESKNGLIKQVSGNYSRGTGFTIDKTISGAELHFEQLEGVYGDFGTGGLIRKIKIAFCMGRR